MAVSKRTRYEVLRRDAFTCRYCGAKAPDVELHVDHVTPVALGGTDEPSNLVAACADCNVGKASSSPDDETVADVAEDAERWAAAIKEAARRIEERPDGEVRFIEHFAEVWDGFYYKSWDAPKGSHEFHSIPRSANWEVTVANYYRSGLTHRGMVESIRAAMDKTGIAPEARFPYFCGVARNKVQRIAEAAAELIERGEV